MALIYRISAEVIAQEATKEGLDREPQTATLLMLARLNVLQQAVSDRYLKDKKPTEQELRTLHGVVTSFMGPRKTHGDDAA